MVYLLLAILSSACISVLMRLSENYIKNKMVMFASNYFICSALSTFFCVQKAAEGSGVSLLSITGMKGFSFALMLGIVSGVLYLASFMLLQFNIKTNGVVLSATFMKLGVLVPTIMAIVIFGEAPSVLQILGITLAVIAIVLIHFEKEEGVKKKTLWLLILLFGGGLTDSLSNVYDKVGSSALKDEYLLATFLVAMICAILLAFKNREKVGVADVFFGLIIGIPNYFSARFLLLALGKVMAIIAYPVYSTATIVLISAAGVVFFRESMNKKKMVALGMIILALILLNVA